MKLPFNTYISKKIYIIDIINDENSDIMVGKSQTPDVIRRRQSTKEYPRNT